MRVPAFDNLKISDENGFITPAWRSILQSLLEGLQANVSDEGLVVPSQSSANISLLNRSPNGALVFDTDTNLANIQINGSWIPLAVGAPIMLPLSISQGGTGQITQQLAINSLAGSVTNGNFLRGDGVNVTMSPIQISDIPFLNPIQLTIDTTINGASLSIGTSYTYESTSASIITLTIVGGATIRNPPTLNGSITTIGFNQEDNFTLTRYSDNTILLT